VSKLPSKLDDPQHTDYQLPPLRPLSGGWRYRLRGGCTGELALLNITLQLVKTRGTVLGLPSGDTTVENFVHLFEGSALGLGSSEEHLYSLSATSSARLQSRRLTWTNAAPLKAAKIIYIFQLMFQRSGGTPNARMQFQSQLEAVARETALARTLAGKISDGYVHEVGPQVVAKLATKRYEQATMPCETPLWLTIRQEVFLSGSL
jgi:hypothetical protein